MASKQELVPVNELDPNKHGVGFGLSVPEYVDGEVLVDVAAVRDALDFARVERLEIYNSGEDEEVEEVGIGGIFSDGAASAVSVKRATATPTFEVRRVQYGDDALMIGNETSSVWSEVVVRTDLDAIRRGVVSSAGVRSAAAWCDGIDEVMRDSIILAGGKSLFYVKKDELVRYVGYAAVAAPTSINAICAGVPIGALILPVTVVGTLTTLDIIKGLQEPKVRINFLTFFGLDVVRIMLHPLQATRRYCYLEK